jgi:2-octaprenylphenol hydroxylase
MSERDVVIIGAGLVGATLANALAQREFRIAVIDTGNPPVVDHGRYDLRVSALGRAAECVFRNLEVWPGISAQRVSPFRKMVVWDAESEGAITFDAAEVGEPQLGHIVENSLVVDALHQRLGNYPNADVLWATEVEKITPHRDAVTIDFGGGEYTAALVVGADGASSWVRKHLRIGARGMDYDQRAIVAQVHTERSHERAAWQRFLPTGPLAFLPLADGSCSIVWSCDRPMADELMTLTDEAFIHRLGESFEFRLGKVSAIGARKWFPLSRSYVEDYVASRCALIGDAAHTVHPLAGQGANLGIADAAALSEVVAGAAGKDIGTRSVLRRYERWRKGENMLMMNAVHGLQRLFQARLTPIRQLRGLGLRLTDASGPVKQLIVRRAMGLSGDLPELAKCSVSIADH